MENILKDQTKFEKVKITMILNFQVHHEKLINQYFKSSKSSGSLSINQYKKIKTVGSTPGILDFYIVNNRKVYQIAKCLVPILSFFSNKLLNGIVCDIWVVLVWIHFLLTFYRKKSSSSLPNQFTIKVILLKI